MPLRALPLTNCEHNARREAAKLSIVSREARGEIADERHSDVPTEEIHDDQPGPDQEAGDAEERGEHTAEQPADQQHAGQNSHYGPGEAQHDKDEYRLHRVEAHKTIALLGKEEKQAADPAENVAEGRGDVCREAQRGRAVRTVGVIGLPARRLSVLLLAILLLRTGVGLLPVGLSIAGGLLIIVLGPVASLVATLLPCLTILLIGVLLHNLSPQICL